MKSHPGKMKKYIKEITRIVSDIYKNSDKNVDVEEIIKYVNSSILGGGSETEWIIPVAIYSIFLIYVLGTEVREYMKNKSVLVLGASQNSKEDKRRLDILFKKWVGSQDLDLYFQRSLDLNKFENDNDIIDNYIREWNTSINLKCDKCDFDEIWFDRITIHGFFIFDTYEKNGKYFAEGKLHKFFKSNGKIIEQYGSLSQSAIYHLIYTICDRMLKKGGNFIMPSAYFDESTLQKIMKLFKETKSLSEEEYSMLEERPALETNMYVSPTKWIKLKHKL